MLTGKRKVGRPRKRKLTTEGVMIPTWKHNTDNPEFTVQQKDLKITFYFPQLLVHKVDHSYSKDIYTYLPVGLLEVSNTAHADLSQYSTSLTSSKKKYRKGALTSCNAQNTKVLQGVNNGIRAKDIQVLNGHLPPEKKVHKEVKSKQLTDYFPVRRSVRKTLLTLKKEKQAEMEDRILSGREDGYEVRDFIGKGRGVVGIHPVKRGDFVLEYSGDLVSVEEAKRREYIYSHDENIGCYMYYFTYKNRQYCVDATRETDRLGRLVNHSKKGNLKTKSILIQDIPRLILVAERDIFPGEELLYDYGDRSKRSLESHPWLAL